MVYYASIDDYLYILLGIGWILFSVYTNKKKKAKQQQNSTTEEKPSPSFLENLMEEIGLKEENADPYEEPQNSPAVTPFTSSVNIPEPVETRMFSQDDFYEESNFDRAPDVLKTETGIKSKVKTAFARDKRVTNKKKNRKKLDIRKAVIYSEILSKKYF